MNKLIVSSEKSIFKKRNRFCILQYQRRIRSIEIMSTIHENDDEDEELMYQVDENGFILSQDGHPLIDETGKRIQLTKQEMQFYKNKINS